MLSAILYMMILSVVLPCILFLIGISTTANAFTNHQNPTLLTVKCIRSEFTGPLHSKADKDNVNKQQQQQQREEPKKFANNNGGNPFDSLFRGLPKIDISSLTSSFSLPNIKDIIPTSFPLSNVNNNSTYQNVKEFDSALAKDIEEALQLANILPTTDTADAPSPPEVTTIAQKEIESVYLNTPDVKPIDGSKNNVITGRAQSDDAPRTQTISKKQQSMFEQTNAASAQKVQISSQSKLDRGDQSYLNAPNVKQWQDQQRTSKGMLEQTNAAQRVQSTQKSETRSVVDSRRMDPSYFHDPDVKQWQDQPRSSQGFGSLNAIPQRRPQNFVEARYNRRDGNDLKPRRGSSHSAYDAQGNVINNYGMNMNVEKDRVRNNYHQGNNKTQQRNVKERPNQYFESDSVLDSINNEEPMQQQESVKSNKIFITEKALELSQKLNLDAYEIYKYKMAYAYAGRDNETTLNEDDVRAYLDQRYEKLLSKVPPGRARRRRPLQQFSEDDNYYLRRARSQRNEDENGWRRFQNRPREQGDANRYSMGNDQRSPRPSSVPLSQLVQEQQQRMSDR